MKKTILIIAVSMFGLIGDNAFAEVSSNAGVEAIGEVGFQDLHVPDVVIGVFDYERHMVQELIFDAKVSIDFEKVAMADHLDATVDYVKLAELITKEARKGEHYFLDTLALATLKEIFTTYPEVAAASIRIHKPAAIPQSATGGILEVEITRQEFEEGIRHAAPIIARIGFNRLHVHTVIGDLPIERENRQDLYVDARATIDLTKVLQTETLDATVDYQQMARIFEDVADAGQYQMIETLALNYSRQLSKQYSNIRHLCVFIRKPGTLPGYPFGTDAITKFSIDYSRN